MHDSISRDIILYKDQEKVDSSLDIFRDLTEPCILSFIETTQRIWGFWNEVFQFRLAWMNLS